MPANWEFKPRPPVHHDEPLNEFHKRIEEHNAPSRTISFWEKLKFLHLISKLKLDTAMIEKLKSRKFIALVVGTILTTTLNYVGVSTEFTLQIVGLISSYIIGQGAVDAAAALRAK